MFWSKQQLKEVWTAAAIRRSGLFDAAWFSAHCPNAPKRAKDALLYYLRGGWREADPSARFSHADYLDMNPDVALLDLCPLAHYVLYGRREQRPINARDKRSITAKKGVYRAKTLLRGLETAWGRLRCRDLIERNRHARILVCVQMFYPHAWQEIRGYLRRLAPYGFDLMVTYQDVDGAEGLLRDVRRRYPAATLIEVGSAGFDLNGFHTALQGVHLQDYDIVFKLHSKGVTHPPFYLEHRLYKRRDWFLCLFEGVLGAENAHRAIDLLLRDASVGAVAAGQMIVRDIPNNQNLVRRLHAKLAPELPVPENYQLIAGMVFAMRAALLQPFAARTMRFDASDRSAFTAAHFEERAVCFPAQTGGYRLAGLPACPGLMARRAKEALRHPENRIGEQLLADERIEIDDVFAVTKLFGAPIERFELQPVPLSALRYPIDIGTDVPLAEAAPVLLLQGDEAAYAAYAADQRLRRRIVPTAEAWREEAERIRQAPLNPKRVIVVNQRGRILDGKEKACVWLWQHGGDYAPTVLRLVLKQDIG